MSATDGSGRLLTVEPVTSRAERRRFAELPFALHGDDHRWRAPVRAFDQWRLDPDRHPYFSAGDAVWLLARANGTPVGRLAAHHDGAGTAAFGFLAIPDDVATVDALFAAARDWLRDEGFGSMVGPWSWTPDEEAGVVAAGHDRPGCTGLPWTPAWYAEHLVRLGGREAVRIAVHRIALDEPWIAAAPPPAAGGGAGVRPGPDHAGAFGDPALVVAGAAAVPDVSDLLAGAGVRSAWRTARLARTRRHETAVCVRCDGDPATAIPALAAAARAADYRCLLAPWAPDDRAPDRELVTYVLDC